VSAFNGITVPSFADCAPTFAYIIVSSFCLYLGRFQCSGEPEIQGPHSFMTYKHLAGIDDMKRRAVRASRFDITGKTLKFYVLMDGLDCHNILLMSR
jgi:hypothetical protein